MNLWLDDIRPAPEGWHWVKTVEEAIECLRENDVLIASLDNDLGEGMTEGRRVVLWMAEHNIWPSGGVLVHSSNTVAVEYMVGMIDRYGPYGS